MEGQGKQVNRRLKAIFGTGPAVAGMAVALAAIVALAASTTATAEGHGGNPLPLSRQALMKEVRNYASSPDHLSGTGRSKAEMKHIASELRRAGLRIHRQAYEFPRFRPTQVDLAVGSTKLPARALAPMLYSGTTARKGVTAPLFDGGTGEFDPTGVAGKIVVVETSYVANALAINLDDAIEAATEGGAKGLVAVTTGPGDQPKWEDVNARAGTGSLPVLMVGKDSGQAVVAAARAARPATLTLRAQTGTACDRDVYGLLRGSDPKRHVIVGTPSSSFVPAASERGSGLAAMLGLAKHFARQPRSERPETLAFLATSGHEVGFLGLPALIAAHGKWFRGSDAYVHLGASLGAPTAVEGPDGQIEVTPEPDPSGSLYNSENSLLTDSIPAGFERSGLSLRTTEPHVRIVGEQAYAYHVGVPVVSFSGASLFFHTAADLPATVDPRILAKEARGFRRAIETITSLHPGELKGANAQAAQYGAQMDPNPTLGTGGSGGTDPRPVPHC